MVVVEGTKSTKAAMTTGQGAITRHGATILTRGRPDPVDLEAMILVEEVAAARDPPSMVARTGTRIEGVAPARMDGLDMSRNSTCLEGTAPMCPMYRLSCSQRSTATLSPGSRARLRQRGSRRRLCTCTRDFPRTRSFSDRLPKAFTASSTWICVRRAWAECPCRLSIALAGAPMSASTSTWTWTPARRPR